MDEPTALEAIQPVIAKLEEAWRKGDSTAWSAACTPDVDFVNLLGMYVTGRDAVTAMHERIFKGPYLNSKVAFTPQHVRSLSDDAVLAIVPNAVQVPSGPVAGTVSCIATMLFVRGDDGWSVASFHNTKREATQPNHTAIMAETHAQR